MTTNEIKASLSNTQNKWSRFYQKVISAHPSVQLQEERYKSELLSTLSLIFAIIILGGSLATILFTGFNSLIMAGVLFGIASFASYIMSRGQLYKRAPLFFISSFALLAYTASLTGNYPALFLVLTFTVLFLLTNLLKLKELAYMHAEGYAAGEMRHGPLALIDERMVIVVICPKDSYYEKTISNLEEDSPSYQWEAAFEEREDDLSYISPFTRMEDDESYEECKGLIMDRISGILDD